MYNISYFKEEDKEVLLQFMRQHSFIILTGSDENGIPVATQVPVLIRQVDDTILLEGHMMRNTDHHKAFCYNQHVLALFTGPHAYVSASWYTDPRQASTWNYMTVHAHGNIELHEDEAHLISILKETTSHYENNDNSTASFDKLSEEYITRLSKAIISFSIKVHKIDNVFKLSQNRDEVSYKNIITELSKGDKMSQLVAESMLERLKQ